MAKQILDWKVERFTGLTGSASIQWTPFDFSTYGVTNTLRCVIEVSCLALASNDHGSSYSNNYIARVIFTWDPTAHGSILKQVVDANDHTDVQWNLTASGTAGSFQIQAVGQATTNTVTRKLIPNDDARPLCVTFRRLLTTEGHRRAHLLRVWKQGVVRDSSGHPTRVRRRVDPTWRLFDAGAPGHLPKLQARREFCVAANSAGRVVACQTRRLGRPHWRSQTSCRSSFGRF